MDGLKPGYNPRMGKLKSAERKSLPSSEFGLPGQRKYPMPDKSHARDAKSRASEMEHKGRLSPAAEKSIDRKADRVLGHTNVKNPGSHAEKLAHC